MSHPQSSTTEADATHGVELMGLWQQLLRASRDDSRARQFVRYFGADAARLFGAQASLPAMDQQHR